MAEIVSLEFAAQKLGDLVNKLRRGEALTLVDSEGTPVAMLVSVKPGSGSKTPVPDRFWAQWEVLAEEIGRAWKGEKSAVEVLAELRR